jgi:3-oxoacyl-ACP reductase-like protein
MNEKEVKIVTLNCFSKRLKMEMNEISLDAPIKELVNNNMYVLSHILVDIHENLELDTISYPINQESELFPTVQSVIDYIQKV